MQPLPIDAHLSEIVDSARRHRRLVLVAPPGSGKTTRVAPALVRAGGLEPGHPALVMLQPRRVAARASAKRIADENGWTLGQEVGYHIRNEKRIGPRTRLRVATEGILTRQLLNDPFLEGVGAVILDEFHERSLHTDLALALVHEAAESVRDDLILIVMSATLDAEPISAFLGGCPIVRVEGRAFPVEVEYEARDQKVPLPDRVADAVARAVETGREDRGDMLVFLPGVEEIRRSQRALAAIADRENLLVLPLHGSLASDEQDKALRPANRRKVVLATNVAETSLTIDGVTTVIDSGLARYARHDPARGLDRLELGWISRASAAQRAGRAGRTAPGRCLRLWPEREDRGRREFDEPEIHRVDLASTVLALKSWGHSDPTTFGWFEPPPRESLDSAERLLVRLGALDDRKAMTPVGRSLLAMPVHPRLGRLLVGSAACGRLEDGASLAALLSEKDIVPPRDRSLFRAEPTRGESDLFPRIDALIEARHQRFAPRLRDQGIDPNAARRVDEVRAELLRLGRHLESSDRDEGGEETLRQLALLAYPDRVCRRRSADPMTALMIGGRGIRLDPESTVRDAEFFLALDPRDVSRGGKREAIVRIASAIDPAWLEEAFPGSVRRERVVSFEESRGRAVASETWSYLDLPLREETHGPVSSTEASAALAEWLAPRAREFVAQDSAASFWLDRLDFLRSAMPGADLPDIDDTVLAEMLISACAGKRTLDEVRRVPLAPLLRGCLTFSQARLIDAEAPETIVVPTGNKIRLTYETGRLPVLAVRLQELFGLADTPRVAGGRVPVLLHLLGPNYRPVQITDDLKSFWESTYFQVRKDLRNRYPKHSWPEDPWNARPEARGSRRQAPG
ncbi:MAG: ATP-dependent helicase HrpB [Planctomycetota bacterium]|nr:ATP-dependent helicase HrpB [Planctomycetota bacterium]